MKERRAVNNQEVERGILISTRTLVSFLSVIIASSYSFTSGLLSLATISSSLGSEELELESVESAFCAWLLTSVILKDEVED